MPVNKLEEILKQKGADKGQKDRDAGDGASELAAEATTPPPKHDDHFNALSRGI